MFYYWRKIILQFLLSNVNRNLARKHVFGSSAGYRGGELPNSCLCAGNKGILQWTLTHNGPAVWWVTVCVAVAWFLQVPADGWKVRGHDEAVPRYQVRVRIVSFESRRNSLGNEQKTRHQRVGRQPDVDFVTGEETVEMEWIHLTAEIFSHRL